jgi:hypothetical protein
VIHRGILTRRRWAHVRARVRLRGNGATLGLSLACQAPSARTAAATATGILACGSKH